MLTTPVSRVKNKIVHTSEQISFVNNAEFLQRNISKDSCSYNQVKHLALLRNEMLNDDPFKQDTTLENHRQKWKRIQALLLHDDTWKLEEILVQWSTSELADRTIKNAQVAW